MKTICSVALLSALMLFSACAKKMAGPIAGGGGPLPPPSAPALSEGWVSSGGELVKDAHNPWWVKNTPVVHYCIAIDAESVTVDEAAVDKTFQLVVRFWRREFADARQYEKMFGQHSFYDGYGIGTQEFQRVPCDENPELKLVIGYGALTAEEQKRFPDPQRFVSIALRTSYDAKELRGKGILYLGSDRGKYQFAHGYEEHPWMNENLLAVALGHELGHAFGVPHVAETRLMDERSVERYIPDQEIRPTNLSDIKPLPPTDEGFRDWYSIFTIEPPRGQVVQNLEKNPPAASLFKAGGRLEFSVQNKLAPSARDVANGHIIEAITVNGAATGKITDIRQTVKFSPLIKMYLTREQQVFANVSYYLDFPGILYPGPMTVSTVGMGKMKLVGNPNTVDVQFESGFLGQLKMFVDVNGTLRDVGAVLN